MNNAQQQPWLAKQGMLHGPVWSAAKIMDEVYRVADLLRPPRSKLSFYGRLGIAKKTFNDHLAAVGMPWIKGYGPPPKEHLVLLISPDGLVVWVSPSVCATRGLDLDDIVDKPARQVLRQERVSAAETALFLSIAHELCIGERAEGTLTSAIATADGRDQPLEVRVTYGRPKQVYFLDCVRVGEPQPVAELQQDELFNVEPGIILPHYAQPRPAMHNMDAIHRFLNATPDEQRDLLNRYLPPYRYHGGEDDNP